MVPLPLRADAATLAFTSCLLLHTVGFSKIPFPVRKSRDQHVCTLTFQRKRFAKKLMKNIYLKSTSTFTK